jgi:hypothetical protein
MSKDDLLKRKVSATVLDDSRLPYLKQGDRIIIDTAVAIFDNDMVIFADKNDNDNFGFIISLNDNTEYLITPLEFNAEPRIYKKESIRGLAKATLISI